MLPQTLLAMLVVFAEPGFPVVDVPGLPAIDGAIEARTVAELREVLVPGRVLVWRHGSAFPAEAWEPLQRFLESGGSLLVLGGEPFTRLVTGEPGQREVGPRTVSLLKYLRLNQCYRVPVGGQQLAPAGPAPASWVRHDLAGDAWAAVLEPRLTDTSLQPDEEGAPGERDAVVTPLYFTHSRDFPSTAAAFAVDRLRGRWAGGRWVFWLLSTPPDARILHQLLREAQRMPGELRVDPVYGCFHAGEKPALFLRAHSARQRQAASTPARAPSEPVEVFLRVYGPDATVKELVPLNIRLNDDKPTRVELDIDPKPGLYRISTTATHDFTQVTQTGFWVFDPQLFESGGRLEFDSFTMRRDGKPEPVVGTTMMSATVHRDFLFEPNAAKWDDTFAELTALKINLVRTGVWSGWKRIIPDGRTIDEAWLRALEAYYLTARKHDIPVLFTFFAFMPESFGGDNPYFDPRALEGQRNFVGGVARRFAPAREMLWDLINEPSFSSPKKPWQCRPNGDEFEQRAFVEWLRRRYSISGSSDPQGWEVTVRNRWRLRPDESIGLPADADFADRTVLENHHPYRAVDYMLFAQDAFADWAAQMKTAIRQAGSTAAFTVGQDEGGLLQRPAPLFHHPVVDFTSMHTWWFNDALLWDGLAARAGGKPLLISETGVMQRERLDGQALRDPDAAARLLSRKIGYAFAAGAFGAVQWCYHMNPYMASDNEAAIGLKRVDGSYKPEHRVLRRFAVFVARNRERFESPVEPQIVVIIPSAEQFSPRDAATAAVQRSVDVLVGRLGQGVRLVPDQRVAADLGQPRAVILPACRGVSEEAWRAVLAAGRGGATVLCTGWFETDDAGLPAERLGQLQRELCVFEPLREPTLAVTTTKPDGQRASAHCGTAHFPRAVTESWYAAEGVPAAHGVRLEGATILHHPLPLEWANEAGPLEDFYREGLAQAAVLGPDLADGQARQHPDGVFVRVISFRDARLLIAVNESPELAQVTLGGSQPALDVPAGEALMAFLSAKGDVIDATDR